MLGVFHGARLGLAVEIKTADISVSRFMLMAPCESNTAPTDYEYWQVTDTTVIVLLQLKFLALNGKLNPGESTPDLYLEIQSTADSIVILIFMTIMTLYTLFMLANVAAGMN